MNHMNKIYRKSQADNLKEKANKRKNNPKYRHIPNNSDILTANEHVKLLETEQYRTIK